MDSKPLSPILTIHYGEEADHYEVEVYRPTLIKKVPLDGEIIQYLQGDEKLRLPYIFKNRVRLNDFSEHGYQAYDCRMLGNEWNIARQPSDERFDVETITYDTNIYLYRNKDIKIDITIEDC